MIAFPMRRRSCTSGIFWSVTKAIFAEVNVPLSEKGLTLCSGTLVDAMIIDVQLATKNEAKCSDHEMSSTKNVDNWHFGMKAHIGVDAQSGAVHSPETTTAKVHDSQVWDELLHGEEQSVWADKSYISAERQAALEAAGQAWRVMRKPCRGEKLDDVEEQTNKLVAKIRAKVKHPLCVIKRQFGYTKTRQEGLTKKVRSSTHSSRLPTSF